MPTFQFRLQALLDQRLEAKKRADEALAGRQQELAAEQQTLQDLEEEVERLTKLHHEKRLELAKSRVRQGLRLTNQTDFLQGLKVDIQAARSGVLAQQIFVEQAEEAVREAQQAAVAYQREVDVLDKYREKVEKRFWAELAYREELEQDEIGNVMYLSRRMNV
jgi:flagellar biosynthesis chaperone FliJ